MVSGGWRPARRRPPRGILVARDVQPSRRRFLVTSLTTLAVTPIGTLFCSDLRSSRTTAAHSSTTKDNNAMQQTTPKAIQLPIEGELPSLDGATGWLNSPPLTRDGLRGKVVLVEFLTYTCINWLRTRF